MHGNDWEWCWDWFGPYSEAAAVDPQGPKEGQRRLLRGGGWLSTPQSCRSANRHDAYHPTYRHFSMGVRVVCGGVVGARTQ